MPKLLRHTLIFQSALLLVGCGAVFFAAGKTASQAFAYGGLALVGPSAAGSWFVFRHSPRSPSPGLGRLVLGWLLKVAATVAVLAWAIQHMVAASAVYLFAGLILAVAAQTLAPVFFRNH